MSRDTAFPGIIVEEVTVQVGRDAVTRTFDTGLAEDVTPDSVKSLLDEVPMYGSQFVDSRLEYQLLVDSPSKYSAMSKARGFIRLKNPFEPDIIDIFNVEEVESGLLRNTYRIEANIRK